MKNKNSIFSFSHWRVFMNTQIVSMLAGILLFSTNVFSQVEQTIKVGNLNRQMIVYAPSGIVANRPLVISMHGRGQTMTDQKNQTQFISVAQANNFVLVYPQSNGADWQLWGTGDTDFILAIIDEMNKQFGIDRDRVYLSGFSMGGMMTYYAANVIADKIAAFAPVTGFLMSGPNATSSRPIPIIHVHGMEDTYVPYSDVQTHLNAWIARNGCPTTAVVTDPYPANVSTAKSIKKHWGPGKEGVEMEFIGVAGVGHWYSDNNWSEDGVFTSQEIWNFCKKFSLKMGTPEFVNAKVFNDKPNQVYVKLSEAINDSVNFTGFTVKFDNTPVSIDSVSLSGPDTLVINLQQSALKTNEIVLSYANGNVVSTLNKKLANFNDTLVDNLIKGAAPRLLAVKTNETGDLLQLKFNMKMLNPTDVSGFSLNAEFNGNIDIDAISSTISAIDSTDLFLTLAQQVYRDYKLTFSYTGNAVVSADSGLLKSTGNLSVDNISNGLAVNITSANMGTDGISLNMLFSKQMAFKEGQTADFSFLRNGKTITVKGFSVTGNQIVFTLNDCVHHGDTLSLTYTPGDVKAADNGPLDAFSNLAIENIIGEPVWLSIPGKIEAENFTFKSGMQTETTGDTGGGLNLGYIGNGDWLEYAIENASDSTDFQISFRVAAPSAGGVIDYYIDGIKEGSITVSSTGNWQIYKSIAGKINISAGKHYLKVVAKVAGFNLNYFDIHENGSGIGEQIKTGVQIYPNPVTNQIFISSPDFTHSNVEILDITGRTILKKATNNEDLLQIQINTIPGFYIVRLSNSTQYVSKRILVIQN